jgi:tellurite methyltransferase
VAKDPENKAQGNGQNGAQKNDWLAHWDDRFTQGEETFDFAPDPLLVKAVGTEDAGLALDLASGAGRNALFLASKGWQVDAVDGSSVGVGIMSKQAEARGVRGKIQPHIADLEVLPPAFTFEPGTYDLIAKLCFMHRPLFAEIRNGLSPGGLFVAKTRVNQPGHPPRRFALDSGELEEMILSWGWEVFDYHELREETADGRWTAELIARKPPR